MRYSEFRLVENDPAVDAETNRAGSGMRPNPNLVPGGLNPSAVASSGDPADDVAADDAARTPQGLEAGPPYPQEDREAVRDMQRKLEALGYSVGNTGIDGKYGPRTQRAVSAFKTDFNLPNTDSGATMTANELTRLGSVEAVDEPTATGNEGRSSSGSFNYADAVPVDDLEPNDEMLNGRESRAATIRFNNPGGMYPAGWQSRFGGEDTGARIGGGHPIAMFPDRVSGAAALFALLDGRLYVSQSVAGALDTWTGSNNASDYVRWMRGNGVDTSETVGNFLARPESAIALASLMARWETGHPYPMSRQEWESAYRRAGVGS